LYIRGKLANRKQGQNGLEWQGQGLVVESVEYCLLNIYTVIDQNA